ncbi:O-fucosyltransferase family protein [Rhodotorula paludigena]|uniref:O-fucosyltransferase family protein n=1 Tax=Rhodotorula paludigena TaxID=86838 RepID=UPI00317E399B
MPRLPSSPTSPTRTALHAGSASPWPDTEGREPEARARKRRGGGAEGAGGAFPLRMDRRRWLVCGLLAFCVLWIVTVDRTTDARGRLRESVHDAAHRLHDLTAEPVLGFDKSLVLSHPEPQKSYKMQMKDGVRYITTMTYGGHANQFIAIQNLLYLGKLLNRVTIIPSLFALHFDELPRDLSDFYDLARFYHDTGIPSVELSSLKRWNLTHPPEVDWISCWSVLEATAGNVNVNDGTMAAHNIIVQYWPLPPTMARASELTAIWFEAFHEFDFDREAQSDWIAKVKKEELPQLDSPAQKQGNKTLSRHETIKPGFHPREDAEPDDRMLCLDTTFFTGSRILKPAYIPDVELEPPRIYEGEGWTKAGQYLRFSSGVEKLADIYLTELFGVSHMRHVPPFISVHIRRGDFQSARGLTSLEMYTDAVQRVRDKLNRRMDNPDGWTGAGHEHQKYFRGVRGEDYAVVATTDEAPDSDFVRQLREELGWKVVDHEAMNTVGELGAWYPTMVDAAILARGRGFVGTEWSTFSYLAGLRVKYWNGGVEDWTPSLT